MLLKKFLKKIFFLCVFFFLPLVLVKAIAEGKLLSCTLAIVNLIDYNGTLALCVSLSMAIDICFC